jgi:hypothetical protein
MTDDLNLDFSPSGFTAILQGLTDGPVLPTLNNLSKMLVYGTSERLRPIRSGEFVRALSEILIPSESIDVSVACASCIHHLIDLINDAARPFSRSGILPRISTHILHPTSQELLEGCLRVLDLMSRHVPGDVGDQCEPDCYLAPFYRLSPADQRRSLQIFGRTTDAVKASSFGSQLVALCELMTHHDSHVQKLAVRVFASIGNTIDMSFVPRDVMPKISTVLLTLIDATTVCRVLKVLERFLRSEGHAELFLAQELDLELVVEQANAKGKFMDLLSDSLTVIALLVPPPDGYEAPFIARRLQGSCEFAALISSFIERIVIDKLGCESLALRVLAAIVRCTTPRRLSELLTSLTTYALTPKLVPDVFLVLRNLRDKSILRRSSILSFFKQANAEMFQQLLADVGDDDRY